MRAPAKPRQTRPTTVARAAPPATPAATRPATKTTAGAAKKTGGAAKKTTESAATPKGPKGPPTTLVKPTSAVGRGASTVSRVSGQLAERVAERRSARRRLRWRTLAWIGAGILVVAALSWLVLYSPVLALEEDEVTISGTTQIVTDAQVREVVTAQAGVPLARLDTAGMAGGIEALTGVRDVQISRVWPSGIEVVVEPRVPVASVAAESGGFVLLDAEGVQLAQTEAPTEALPVITVPLGQDNTAASLQAVLTVLSELPPELLAEVADAGAQTPNQVRFTLTDGAEVIWGSATDGELKVRVLATLRGIPAAVYDLSSPLTPITRE
ncbi:FtsQ-type POTRA domain-containing protein [Occultella glacieicola]|uniref:FtsQ-type POTRA domain-containing protein n=1 Tax=Occultella glacieicola TaxID=2518684 RepID=A0ABY2E1A0_9MICO|nr:cell division protein FtsQ/DivIB [Occultella glacieicola]TDE90823.1 FtsQ-type POTRA domain-containing protein [Occultella glacieicola]